MQRQSSTGHRAGVIEGRAIKDTLGVRRIDRLPGTTGGSIGREQGIASITCMEHQRLEDGHGKMIP